MFLELFFKNKDHVFQKMKTILRQKGESFSLINKISSYSHNEILLELPRKTEERINISRLLLPVSKTEYIFVTSLIYDINIHRDL